MLLEEGHLDLFAFMLLSDSPSLSQPFDRARETPVPVVSVNVLPRSPLSLNQVARNVEETENLEKEVNHAERSNSNSVNKWASDQPHQKDEDPEQDRGVENVMEYFSSDKEGAGTVAQAETDHLDKSKDNSKDVKRWHKHFNKGHQKKTHNDNSLSLHHKSTPSEFLEELPSEKGHNDLH